MPNYYQTTEALPDGTIEVTDTLPKPDYYKSLRRTNNLSSSLNNSQVITPAAATTTAATPVPFGSTMNRSSVNNIATNNGTLTRSKSISRSPSFKPSGKEVECGVLMLDGVEQIFTIDST
ncbi:unnamed protein product [Dibothriocephalus latus]|uniref:Uncharacterized protein n=1 Tax=Dibothriocephalus latus TaxID=60516 RepID=A0A3P6SSY6_DIBLA|nr:unnamed protein product [Dibothriocephalus latus]